MKISEAMGKNGRFEVLSRSAAKFHYIEILFSIANCFIVVSTWSAIEWAFLLLHCSCHFLYPVVVVKHEFELSITLFGNTVIKIQTHTVDLLTEQRDLISTLNKVIGSTSVIGGFLSQRTSNTDLMFPFAVVTLYKLSEKKELLLTRNA